MPTVYVERNNGNQYEFDPADHFNVLDDGSLVIYWDGCRIGQYKPDEWCSVQVDDDGDEDDVNGWTAPSMWNPNTSPVLSAMIGDSASASGGSVTLTGGDLVAEDDEEDSDPSIIVRAIALKHAAAISLSHSPWVVLADARRFEAYLLGGESAS